MADGKRAINSSKVWTTLITNLDYLPGLLTLEYSLRKHNSAYPLVALYTDTFPESGRAALAARGIAAQRIEYLLPTRSSRDYSQDPRFYDCWSKLTPFSLAQYDRVVQLDSDMVLLQNMDELMELELDDPAEAAKGDVNTSRRVFAASYACTCNPLRKAHYPADWVPANCAFTSQHGNPDAAQEEGADPATVPLAILNGGLQVVRPCKELFVQIVEHMEDNAASMDFADQSLLSDLFRGRWVALPYTYNALKTLRWEGVHDAIWRDDRVKNVHYILTPKPWEDLDQNGDANPGAEETTGWWAAINKERKAKELAKGVNDGF
ncbi:glycosyl transferase [Magnaporthiopsis poae ATCC 64411]|uniref:Glycosyl transferase n=1 Tax=Magnaporthiopsis poae (strain ATCC 64411 / 73-15) TaxID=644358 RepID=A0A0C4E5V6_MAGP6|nr:glycosyl transferase [Magnaporthiopsis poae ATCC 64411]